MKPLQQYFCMVPFVFHYFTKWNLGFFLKLSFLAFLEVYEFHTVCGKLLKASAVIHRLNREGLVLGRKKRPELLVFYPVFLYLSRLITILIRRLWKHSTSVLTGWSHTTVRAFVHHHCICPEFDSRVWFPGLLMVLVLVVQGLFFPGSPGISLRAEKQNKINQNKINNFMICFFYLFTLPVLILIRKYSMKPKHRNCLLTNTVTNLKKNVWYSITDDRRYS